MYNAEFMEEFHNLVEMTPAFKGQLYDQSIVDIATEGNTREGDMI